MTLLSIGVSCLYNYVLRDGTDVNLPLLPNLPMRAKLVAREMTRNLIACGNLMAVEGDDEEEFWENEFRRTIIQPETGAMNGKLNPNLKAYNVRSK